MPFKFFRKWFGSNTGDDDDEIDISMSSRKPPLQPSTLSKKTPNDAVNPTVQHEMNLRETLLWQNHESAHPELQDIDNNGKELAQKAFLERVRAEQEKDGTSDNKWRSQIINDKKNDSLEQDKDGPEMDKY